VLTAIPAQAATCLYDAVNKEVNITGAATDASVRVGAGGAILFDSDLDASNGVQCGIATVNNTDGIFFGTAAVAAEDFNTVVIDLSGGPFAPGETPEATGTSEIEIDRFTTLALVMT
jgi:hypothetical protein